MSNVDPATIEGFGDEWSRFDPRGASLAEREALFDAYFKVFPWDALPHGAVGFDAGCGSGRWAAFVAPRVGKLHCIDASAAAVAVARDHLADQPNVELAVASVDAMPIKDSTMDFGYSLGVLHHVPDTSAAIRACARKLKPGAPLLLYLYYAFDGRPAWFREIWRASNLVRGVVSRLPHGARFVASQALAATVYFPLARGARALEKLGLDVDDLPLSTYRDRSFYVMRNDALDRFGTRLEQRFTRAQIETMMHAAGLERVAFSDAAPYWCAVGYRAG